MSTSSNDHESSVSEDDMPPNARRAARAAKHHASQFLYLRHALWAPANRTVTSSTLSCHGGRFVGGCVETETDTYKQGCN